jgi:hypothetical protein
VIDRTVIGIRYWPGITRRKGMVKKKRRRRRRRRRRRLRKDIRAAGSGAIGSRSCSSRYGGLPTQDTGSSRWFEPAVAAVEAAGVVAAVIATVRRALELLLVLTQGC